MPELTILLPGHRSELLAAAVEADKLTQLNQDAEMQITGLPDGMQSGKPSVAFVFELPDGTVLFAETSWRLFATAFWSLASSFGDERPSMAGGAVEYDVDGSGRKVQVEITESGTPFAQCELCGERKDFNSGEDEKVAQWLHRHFREKHPGRSAP